MEFKTFQMTFQEALRKRNFAYTVCAVLGVSNLLLCGIVFFKSDKFVLYPWPGLQGYPGLEFNGYDFSDSYLQEFSDRLTSRLLTMNPQTVQSRLNDFVVFTDHSPALLKKLKIQADKIKSENISTAFYPKEFSIVRQSRKIEVTGDFYSYFGTDKAPVIHLRKVILHWGQGKNGIFLLKDFDFEESSQ